MLYRVLLMCDARITNNSNRAWNRYLSASVAVPTRIAAKPVTLFTARAPTGGAFRLDLPIGDTF